jgi:2-C-methyl-D-erythritol 4-phosphate cytidylyltransferase/2-C-methyl-D-erythritol 2,4-cyclodiphosphate synthase
VIESHKSQKDLWLFYRGDYMVTVIIAAAGTGSRMGAGINKILLPLRGQPVLLYSVRMYAGLPEVDQIIIVASPGEEKQIRDLVSGAEIQIAVDVVAGGSERQYSIANALHNVKEEAEIIVVHDGARPLIEVDIAAKVIAAAREYKAAGVAVPVKDTIKMVSEQGYINGTPDRKLLWGIQTPQAFEARLLKEAYRQAGEQKFLGTDDAALVERLGIPVRIVRGDYRNLKITTPEDLIVAEALLGEKEAGTVFRVGIGYDVHRLIEGRKLILGGVEVPHTHGLEGHSDADVLLHAIKDALLGAAALGDIGRHFPDSDQQYKGISSLLLLAKVGDILGASGYMVNNIDAIIVAQKPKLAPFINVMNDNIAKTLKLVSGQVNVKATTTEGLGFAGQGEGIAAYATVSIIKKTGA